MRLLKVWIAALLLSAAFSDACFAGEKKPKELINDPSFERSRLSSFRFDGVVDVKKTKIDRTEGLAHSGSKCLRLVKLPGIKDGKFSATLTKNFGKDAAKYGDRIVMMVCLRATMNKDSIVNLGLSAHTDQGEIKRMEIKTVDVDNRWDCHTLALIVPDESAAGDKYEISMFISVEPRSGMNTAYQSWAEVLVDDVHVIREPKK